MNFNNMLKEKNINLTEQQNQAVTFFKGMVLLLAVPGSGKTTSIICRVARLMSEHNVLPSSICNITFSKAAAKEMGKRFKKLFPELQPPHFSTIHALSFSIVREFLKSKNIAYTIIEGDTKDKDINKNNIIKKIFLNINKEYPNEEVTNQVTGFISYVRNSLIDLSNTTQSKEILKKAEEQFENPLEIYNTYMNIKKEKNWVDFDDMLCIANNVLSTNHPISEKFKKKFEFIQVDEAQDISLVQHQIITKLSQYSSNLCQIADDDQCIYSWRGSDPNIMLNIKDEFPETTIIYMERNFRSAPLIVNKCNEFIKKNKKRYKKNMYTENKFEGKIKVFKNITVMDQTYNIVQQILSESEKDFTNTAILYRNNSSALPIILECITQKLPFNINLKKNAIFKQFILDDLMAFYLFANDTSNKDAFLTIVYKINLIFVKKAKLQDIVNKAEGNILNSLIDLNINSFKLTTFKMQLNHLKNSKNATEFLKVLFDELNYKEYIIKKADENSIDILYALAQNENSIENVILKIAKLLDKLANKEYEPNGIDLMTLHGSKGLEWKNVYLIDFSNNIIPNEKSDEEEERRLAYVGFSRAIENLYINYYFKGDKPLDPSQFIEELLPEEAKKNNNDELSINNKIFHSTFGLGKIIDKDNEMLTIKFDKFGIKKLSKRISLEKKLIKAV